MLHLTELVVHRHLEIAQGTTLYFNPGKNIVLGKNASGKTTLLKLISSCFRLMIEHWDTLEKEKSCLSFQLFSSGEMKVNSAPFRTTATISVKVDFNNTPQELIEPSKDRNLIESITSSEKNNSHPIEITVNIKDSQGIEIRIVKTSENITVNHSTYGEYTVKEGASHVTSLILSALIGAPNLKENENRFPGWIIPLLYLRTSCIRVDESLDLYLSITDPQYFKMALSTRTDLPSAPPSVMIIFDTEKDPVIDCSYLPMTDEADDSVMLSIENKNPATILDVSKQIILTKAHCKFLDKISHILGIENCEMVLNLLESDFLPNKASEKRKTYPIKANYGNPIFSFRRKSGATYGVERLSYGEKRLFAFVYHVFACENVIIADEVVNGLHHKWIKECTNLIESRQSFVTSQNPLLMDYITLSNVDDVRKTFIICRAEEHENQRWLSLRNLTEFDAEEFIRAKKIGIESISTILRNRGLW